MTFIAADLKHRAQILEPIQAAGDSGEALLTYNYKATVWCDLKPMKFQGTQIRYIRDQQVTELPTHEFKMRKNPTLGVDFLGPRPLLKGITFLRIDQGEGRWRVWRVAGAVDDTCILQRRPGRRNHLCSDP